MIKLLFKININKGFTLAELLIVVAILSILVAVSIPIFSNQLEKSRNAVDIHNAKTIANCIIYYLMENPDTLKQFTNDCKLTGGMHYAQVSVSGKRMSIYPGFDTALAQAGLNNITCKSKTKWIGYRIAITNYSATNPNPEDIRIYYWGVPVANSDKIHSNNSLSHYVNDADPTGFKDAMRGTS